TFVILTLKVRLQFLRSFSEVSFIHNSVASIHATGFVASDFHSHLFTYSSSRQVSSRCPSQIMNQCSRKLAFFAGCFPCLFEVSDLLALVMKNIGTIEPTLFVPFLKQLQ